VCISAYLSQIRYIEHPNISCKHRGHGYLIRRSILKLTADFNAQTSNHGWFFSMIELPTLLLTANASSIAGYAPSSMTRVTQ
jgi:hypothetical protein